MHPLRDSNSRSRLVGVRLWMSTGHPFTTRPSSPYRNNYKGKEMPDGISFPLVPPQGLEPWTPWLRAIHHRSKKPPYLANFQGACNWNQPIFLLQRDSTKVFPLNKRSAFTIKIPSYSPLKTIIGHLLFFVKYVRVYLINSQGVEPLPYALLYHAKWRYYVLFSSK